MCGSWRSSGYIRYVNSTCSSEAGVHTEIYSIYAHISYIYIWAYMMDRLYAKSSLQMLPLKLSTKTS
jgi:hypothetical protein